MVKITLKGIIPLVLLLLTACDAHNDTEQAVDFSKRSDSNVSSSHTNAINQSKPGKTLRFGFDLRSTVQEDARQYQPFLAYLEKKTGYDFELVLTTKGDDLAEKLGSGDVQFAAIGAVSYIKARKKYGVKPVVRGLNHESKAEYQSVIVTQADSRITQIEQLRGKHFAFGSTNSTQGHLIPRIDLLDHNITLPDLAEYTYTGSHRNCANMVITGRADACGMQDTMGKELATQGLVRIIHTSDYYPSSGIAANAQVTDAIIAKLQHAMLEFNPSAQHKPALYNWHKTEMPNGFGKASTKDYQILSHWISKLGFAQ